MRSLRTLLAAAAVAAALVPAVASAGIVPCSGAHPVTIQQEDGHPMIVVTPPPYAC